MEAYDYKRQCWVNGEEGRKLLLGQLQEELETVLGPKGEDFLRFIGSKETVREAAEKIRERIKGVRNGKA